MKKQEIKANTPENECNLPDEHSSCAKSQIEEELKKITSTKAQLATIKTELDKMIDVFVQNKSILSRAAKFWGQLPWWQKTIAGVIIIAPLIVLSIVTHLLVLMVISLFTLVAGVASSFLLDNHYQQSQNDKNNLKKGILNLADTLGIIIESLEQLRNELANAIAKFQTENEHLKISVDQLGLQVEQLKSQITHLVGVEQQLSLTKEKLEKTSTKFATSVQEHTELLEKNKLQFAETINDYEQRQAQLTVKINELDEVKTAMGLELDQANIIAHTLEATINELTQVVIADDTERAEFHERLVEFLSDKKRSFDQIVERIDEAEDRVSLVQAELKLSNERYANLLKRAEGQLGRLENLANYENSTPALPQIGFYANKPAQKQVQTVNMPPLILN